MKRGGTTPGSGGGRLSWGLSKRIRGFSARQAQLAEKFAIRTTLRSLPVCRQPGLRPESCWNASPGRRASLQKIFADETADEARGSGEAEPPCPRDAC